MQWYADLIFLALLTYNSTFLGHCLGNFILVRPVKQQRRQLELIHCFRCCIIGSRVYLFLSVLVYMHEQQNCSHKTWHIGVEIVSCGRSKITCFSVKEKTLSFLHYRAYSSSLLCALIACNHLLFFIHLLFFTFLSKFSNILPFLALFKNVFALFLVFFWKTAWMPLLFRIDLALCFDIMIFSLGGKNYIAKNEKCIIFSKSLYVNSNPEIQFLNWKMFSIYSFSYSWFWKIAIAQIIYIHIVYIMYVLDIFILAMNIFWVFNYYFSICLWFLIFCFSAAWSLFSYIAYCLLM